jgi:PTS system nitrogen regulatory IIA component
VAFGDILTAQRVSVSTADEGLVRDKGSALRRLSELLASGATTVNVEQILAVLTAREELQSTGVGGGVAVPHGSVELLDTQIGALLVCPSPIPFDAIDGSPVNILFALVGPKGKPAQHLKVLARMSRLLRKDAFRVKLASAARGEDAYVLIRDNEPGAPR